MLLRFVTFWGFKYVLDMKSRACSESLSVSKGHKSEDGVEFQDNNQWLDLKPLLASVIKTS